MAVIYVLVFWAGAVAWFDVRQHRVPNLLLVLLLVPAILSLVLDRKGLLGVSVWPSVLGFLLGGAILLPGYGIAKMGAGDVKFAAVLGLLLGWRPLLNMLLLAALLLGAVSALVFWLDREQQGRGQRRIPAAPVLAAAFGAVLLAQCMQWEMLV